MIDATQALMPSTLRAAWALAKRELIRFLGQRTRVAGAVGQPIIFWKLWIVSY